MALGRGQEQRVWRRAIGDIRPIDLEARRAAASRSEVADDLVRVKLLSDHTPVGFCADMHRGYMECRGIGIINVEELFGIRFVRLEKRIDLTVTFVEDHEGVEADRTGLERRTFDILGFHGELLRP